MISALIPYIILYIYNDQSNQIYLFSYMSLIIVQVMDMIRLFFSRLIEKKNPFEKDLNHFHHKLLNNFNLNLTLLIYLSLSFIPFLIIEIFKLDPFLILITQIALFFSLNHVYSIKKS